MARSSEPSRPDEPWTKLVREAEPSFLGQPEPAFSSFSPVNQAATPFFLFYPADMRVPRVSLSVRMTGGATDTWTPLTWTLTVDWSTLTSQH